MPRRAAGAPMRLALAASAPAAAAAEVFTTNAVCLKNQCINPIFPGLEDLSALESSSFVCSSLQKVITSGALNFCGGAIHYDPALPAVGDTTDVAQAVKMQDQAALKMFFYHLAGMGRDSFEYTEMEYADDCTKSIWRMVCYTYFPRAKLGCQDGMVTNYIRPCQSSCENYLRSCNVECCDEGVRCVFTHEKVLPGGFVEMQKGYIPHDGPSSLCTGGARRAFAAPSAALWALLALLHGALASGREGAAAPEGRWRGGRAAWAVAALAAVAAVGLQGCNLDVPTHRVANWRAEADYLIKYSFVPPGETAKVAMLNSCALRDLSPTLQCSGRGVCRLWDDRHLESTAAFCQCDRDWADPECTTRRKSQVVAFLLSVFLGPFGADQFYLGFPIAGGLKLATLGGFGVWWIIDIIRVGSSPVVTPNFKVASDFPHWLFVILTVFLAMLIGFAISYLTLIKHFASRRKDALLMQAEEEHRLALATGGTAGAKLDGPVGQTYGSMGARAP